MPDFETLDELPLDLEDEKATPAKAPVAPTKAATTTAEEQKAKSSADPEELSDEFLDEFLKGLN